ncbi:MAG: hypothetical protein GTN64_05555 [Candidatus Latescibacteria bacterium]|nr:hypothetical protein [Candidatus Latescibacterota bacterium]NIO78075.1 hypothetical protein [Candidatus Latescibacterota bacterium]
MGIKRRIATMIRAHWLIGDPLTEIERDILSLIDLAGEDESLRQEIIDALNALRQYAGELNATADRVQYAVEGKEKELRNAKKQLKKTEDRRRNQKAALERERLRYGAAPGGSCPSCS